MASKAIKGYKFVFGGKSRPGIVGVKPKSGGVVDEFKSRKLKQLGRTQRKLKSQDKEMGEAMGEAKKKGATRKQLVKGRKFQRDIRRAKREGDKLRKDVLRVGKEDGGVVNVKRPRNPMRKGPMKVKKPENKPSPKLNEKLKKSMNKLQTEGLRREMKKGGKVDDKKKTKKPLGGRLKKPKPGSYDYQLQETMKPPYKRKEMKKGGKALKPVDKEKNPGLAKLPTQVRNKMGYMKKGGRVKKFPDLSGDGKVTKKDILMGRGVIKKKKFGGGKK
jgi:hypothetical protein